MYSISKAKSDKENCQALLHKVYIMTSSFRIFQATFDLKRLDHDSQLYFEKFVCIHLSALCDTIKCFAWNGSSTDRMTGKKAKAKDLMTQYSHNKNFRS